MQLASVTLGKNRVPVAVDRWSPLMLTTTGVWRDKSRTSDIEVD